MRELFESYFVEALHDAKLRELANSYERKGFAVRQPRDGEDSAFDLLMENPKDGRITAFEVKVSPLEKSARAQIDRLLEKARDKNYDFHVVTIARPTKYFIAIDWLDQALNDYLLDNPICELDALSTHTTYEVAGTTIRSIRIEGEKAKVKLDGSIDAALQYGSGSDLHAGNAWESSRSVPFEGEVTLDLLSKRIETADLAIDLSDW